MILRKPYAFLIKYFQRINIFLLLLVGFVFYKNLELYQFVKEYLDTGIYNTLIDSINNYANIYVYLAFIFILIITIVLAYLLKYKDKPYLSYIYIFILCFVTFCFFLYTDNYFTYKVQDGFNLVATRVVKDLLFISTIPYYPVILILIIRSIGLDLKSFGFNQDKEFTEISEEDREEIEVEVGFDKDRFTRKIKYYFRHFKYFFLEHKNPLIIVFSLVFILFGYNFYHYFYVDNRIYNMNESFNSNNYTISVRHSYLTNKDYAGNIVSEDGRYFILIDMSIKNKLAISRDFDIEKMMLFVDNDYYVPTVRFNSYFTDMGNLYNNKQIKANDNVSYVLVYEINKPSEGANFVLKYQDVNNGGKLIRVKIKVLDISTFKTKGNYKFNEDVSIPINKGEKVNFKLDTLIFLTSTTYRYQQCGPYSCPIYEKELVAKDGYKILYLKGDYGDYTTQEFISFLKKYGKLRYVKDGKTKDINLDFAITGSYQGKHIYLLVSDEVVEADSISLMFTIRTYQYFYNLKGE